MGVKIADKLEQFNNGTYYLVDSSAVEYVDKDGNVKSVKDVLDYGIDELSKEDVERLLGLTKEEIEAMTDLILDTEVRIDKTYSSSKIYTDIQQCLEDSKTYTLEELGKKFGASYEVVTSTDDMVSQDHLYLLNNDNGYDIYIVGVDNTPVVIGDTAIDLSGYVTKTEIESELGTEILGTTSQTVKGAINELFQSVTTDLTDIENRITTNETNITDLQEQIDNLDIPEDVDLTGINTKLSQLETKANLIPVTGDNPTDKNLNNYIENGSYSIGISDNYSNVPVKLSGLLTVIRANTYRLQIYTVVTNNNVYFRKSTDWGKTWTSWVLLNGSSGGSDNGTNNDVYTTEEQAVGTWINGKTLYRRTIEDNTLRETGTDMIKLFAYNTNMKLVKFEGVVTLANANGQTFIRSLPYRKDSEEVYVTKTTLDTLRLDSYLTNFKLGGYIVSVYYYKV